MQNKIKVSEIFPSIQGEGRYAGYPMLFIRLSGCTRACSWCDTKYHTKGKYWNIDKLIERINKSKLDIVCWTGGEPLLQRDKIKNIIECCTKKNHHIETNGDLISDDDILGFNYIAISPKDRKVAKKVSKFSNNNPSSNRDNEQVDIKVVTDLKKVGLWGLKRASMLMPLSTYNKKKDLEIQRSVWNYCVKHNLKFTPRYQTWIWGKKRSI